MSERQAAAHVLRMVHKYELQWFMFMHHAMAEILGFRHPAHGLYL
jgi:hypothetical protein